MIYLVVVKFLVFVSEVVSIFSKIHTWIIGRAKGYLCPPQLNYWGGACPGCPPKSTPMPFSHLNELNSNHCQLPRDSHSLLLHRTSHDYHWLLLSTCTATVPSASAVLLRYINRSFIICIQTVSATATVLNPVL